MSGSEASENEQEAGLSETRKSSLTDEVRAGVDPSGAGGGAPDGDETERVGGEEGDSDQTIGTLDAEVPAGGTRSEARPSGRLGSAAALGGDTDSVPPGMVLRGRASYRILRSIGRGGMGTVYLAQVEDDEAEGEERMPDEVAVKIMPGTSSASAVPRAEIGVMKALRHPNVVRLYDWSFDKNLSFAVMDYHARGSLLDRLKERGALAADQALRLLLDILSALVEAHGRGMLHLDIKPANVLIGRDGRFLLTDFGIAGTLFQDRARRVVGTPAFMSPEQARGEMSTLDARSDLFMLGATVWQALTADFSIQRRPPTIVLKERKTRSFELLSRRVPPELYDLAQIIDELLEFDSHNRPGTAAEVLHRARQLSFSSSDTTMEISAPDVGAPMSAAKAEKLRQEITDPVLADLLDMEGTFFELRVYSDQRVICREGEHSYSVYVLLSGALDVLRGGKLVYVQRDEGAIVGEVAALVGSPRTATLRAQGETVVAVFKGAELEQAARRMPALAVRIMKNLASILAERDRA